MKYRIPAAAILSLLLLITLSSCSINKMAMKSVSDMLTGEGGSDVFTSDTDPQLVGDALPFAIKLYETLLAQDPEHEGLILTTGSLFIMYANAFVQGPADMLPSRDYKKKESERERAKQMYLRGVDILMTGLESKYPGYSSAAAEGKAEQYIAKFKAEDVPLLYWLVAGTLSAYAITPLDLHLGMKVGESSRLIARAYELDPDFNDGTIDDFYILFHASLPESLGGDKSLVDTHYERAVAKSKGLSASPYVSYASSVCVPAQDYEKFKELLQKALAVDVNINPSTRLMNIISQQKAAYLMENAGDFFIDTGEDEWFYGSEDEYDEGFADFD